MLKNFLISIFNIIDNTLGFIGIDTDKLMAKLQVRWLYNGKLNRRLFRSNEERGKLNLYISFAASWSTLQPPFENGFKEIQPTRSKNENLIYHWESNQWSGDFPFAGSANSHFSQRRIV